MSIWNSNLLCVEEIEELSRNYVFTVPEIECLYERFKYLDRSNAGHLTFAEFHMIPEFYSNPFSKLIVEHLERKTNYERITFGTFIEFMNLFSSKTDKSGRIEFLFEIFDLENNGRLCRKTLNKIYFMMTKSESRNEVSELLKQYDLDNKGYLDIDDFTRLFLEDPSLDECMIIDFKKNIEDAKDENIWDILWPKYSSKKR